jgi:hypothetical protein
MDPLSFIDPVGMVMGAFMMVGAHTGDADQRYEAACWDTLSWYRCHEENFGNVHTPAYMRTLAVGHNPGRPRTVTVRTARVYR